MRNIVPAAGIIAALVLSACAVGAGPTPMASVDTLEVSLTAADLLALQYLTLPPCTASGTPVCRDENTSSLIKIASLRAYKAVTAAQGVVDLGLDATSTDAAVTAATAAIAAFQAAIPLPVKGK